MTETEPPRHPARCCALIVTWEPDIAVLLALVERLIADDCPCRVIDNGSSCAGPMEQAFSVLPADRLAVTWLPENRGLAVALNRGLEQARRQGFHYALLFDQDSGIDAGFSQAMQDAFREAAALSDRPLAALGPRLQDPGSGRQTPFRVFDRWLFRSDRRLAPGQPFYDAGFLVTSGTLLDLSTLDEIGLMRESYFIDNIDLEWCFRARARGHAVAGTDRARLHHRIGEASERWVVRRGWVVEHSPLRCYYATRNRFHLHRLAHAPAAWAWRDRIRFVLKSAWLLLCTGQRRAYWQSIRQGLRDSHFDTVPPADGSVSPDETPAPTVLVLLSTWNGAAWLREQVESILAQRHVHCTVLCRDDGSTDETPAMLKALCEQWPGRIRLLRDEAGSLGASGSFSRLMEAACRGPLVSAPDTLVALADQDDVWDPDRLHVTAQALRLTEDGDCGMPVLVHSDLRVVDERRHLLAASMMQYQGLRPGRGGRVAQLVGNPVTGCTVLCNRALLKRALPVPAGAVMHDWWLAVVATLYGRRVYIDRPLVDYRQHGRNAIGARAHTRAPGGLLRRLMDRSHQSAFEQIAAQTAEVLQRHCDDLSLLQRAAARLIIRQPRLPAPLQKVVYRLLRRL